ncbi:hypothetical protein [Sulfitobacter noctilucae]|uniref:hypothetical protein n=1 Tax=Sulfitobacter noctilucae TaxID=1342302 RepID=UPI0012693879|nr:hypothetical protein [Sulfitobacter noctilucae]
MFPKPASMVNKLPIQCLIQISGSIDKEFHVSDTPPMYRRRSISSLYKVLTCLALVLTLVFAPPSASHAGAGMHDGGHHASATQHDHDASDGSISYMSSHATQSSCGSTSASPSDDESTGQCCSGICSSVVLDDTTVDAAIQPTGEKYLTLYAQSDSIKPSGFLRPPQSLI